MWTLKCQRKKLQKKLDTLTSYPSKKKCQDQIEAKDDEIEDSEEAKLDTQIVARQHQNYI